MSNYSLKPIYWELLCHMNLVRLYMCSKQLLFFFYTANSTF